MHGLVHAEFCAHATGRLGRDGWKAVVADAGLEGRQWSLSDTYPDEELLALVGAVAARTGESAQEVLQAFGEAVAPRLVETYSAFIDPRWSAADLLERVETIIHRTVRLQQPGADPPRLAAERLAEDEVRIVYGSPRRLCGLGKGIVHGVGARYGSRVDIEEPSCMLEGDLFCDLRIRLGPQEQAATAPR